MQALAQELLPLIAPAVIAAGGKFGIVGHSLGSWAAYEVMLALRTAGMISHDDPVCVLPGLPQHGMLSAFSG